MISAILTAAGQSTRMNGENKLTKEVKGMPLIKHSIKNILDSSIDELIIILGHEKEIIEKLIINNKKIKIVFNKNFKNGLSSSIKTGLKHLSKNTNAFFICLADMPLVNKNIYNELIESMKNNEIVVPTYKGQYGNPVLFSKSMKSSIMKIQGDIGAKNLIELNKDKVLKHEVDDRGIKKDFNTIDNFDI